VISRPTASRSIHGVTWIVSPYDEFAVEEALRIKEKRGQARSWRSRSVPIG